MSEENNVCLPSPWSHGPHLPLKLVIAWRLGFADSIRRGRASAGCHAGRWNGPASIALLGCAVQLLSESDGLRKLHAAGLGTRGHPSLLLIKFLQTSSKTGGRPAGRMKDLERWVLADPPTSPQARFVSDGRSCSVLSLLETSSR